VSAAEAELRRAWRQVAGSDHELVIADLLARHREPHRRYHTAAHVMWVLRHLADLVDALPAAERSQCDAPAIRAAALFHDVIYDPTSSANEANSAALAHRALAELGWPPQRADHVASMILDTATHRPSSDDAALLIDADLAVLAADAAGYQAYVNGVRAEYGHVSDTGWRVGRANVLRTFLRQPQLFATEVGRARYERRARANITAELAALDPDPPAV
jgi:predicted metal-dependent HD superfamily phosphohydrolase